MAIRRAQVVIGAGYGDEGKGLITDFLTARLGSEGLVVRFNGGAQAGHTVVTPDGKRHVFSHFGSGSLVGAATYLSRFFVCNPLLYLQEWTRLRDIGITPIVHVDPKAAVTTPYDMVINQVTEAARQTARHGSCGIGFGETIERNLSPRFSLSVGELGQADHLRRKLDDIRRHWVPARLASLGIGKEHWGRQEWIFRSDELLEKFMGDVGAFLDAVIVAGIGLVKRRVASGVIFEGAQGLLLDQNRRDAFPHVTRSNTGLRNVVALAQEAEIDRLDVTYVTRAYATRHGAGPMPHELPAAPYAGIRDDTNIANPFQGSLRFGWLDLDILAASLRADLAAADTLRVDHRLAITCLDQIDDTVTFVQAGAPHRAGKEAFIEMILRSTGAAKGMISEGPARDDVFDVEAKPATPNGIQLPGNPFSFV